VRLGRRIFDNLKKAMAYLIAVHVPIAGVSLLSVASGWPLFLLPVHVVFLELIIDPACSIAYEAEPEEPDIMRRPPRPATAGLFTLPHVALAFVQGLIVTGAVGAVFGLALIRGQGEQDARALAFTTLIVANIGLILTNRSWSETILASIRRRNAALWWVVGGALLFLALVLATPALRGLFLFAPLHGDDIVLCLGAGTLSVAWFEIFKLFRRSKILAVQGLRSRMAQRTIRLHQARRYAEVPPSRRRRRNGTLPHSPSRETGTGSAGGRGAAPVSRGPAG
jgi:Ca2+-transporting ATPase